MWRAFFELVIRCHLPALDFKCLLESDLTHLIQMHSFSTPWKH